MNDDFTPGSGFFMTVQIELPQQRAVHLYTELARTVRESGLLRRRYAYYWSRIALAVAAFVLVWAGIIALGNSWFQLVLAAVLGVVVTQFGFLGHDARPPADVRVRRMERVDVAHPRRRLRRSQLRLVEGQAQPPPRRAEPGGSRPRRRTRPHRVHPRHRRPPHHRRRRLVHAPTGLAVLPVADAGGHQPAHREPAHPARTRRRGAPSRRGGHGHRPTRRPTWRCC